jgi:2-phospho-L-lactate transferase/gluconeogenesis factor (CofD/UPF0052 family)
MSGVVGNFEEAIRQTSRVLAVRGQIVPSTLEDVSLHARTTDGREIAGESNITADVGRGTSDARIREVYLEPRTLPRTPKPSALSSTPTS